MGQSVSLPADSPRPPHLNPTSPSDLAYYPPYHSKYNPIERGWGVLEQHWHGSLLDAVETVLNFAQSMTWRGVHATVQRIHELYHAAVLHLQSHAHAGTAL